VDVSVVGWINRETIQELEKLSNDGVLVLDLLLSPKNPKEWDLRLRSRGFIGEDEEADLLNALKGRIQKLMISPTSNLQKELENAARNCVYDETRRSPVIFTTVAYSA
jgi:mRNA degradation ribonuclease J1/J2